MTFQLCAGRHMIPGDPPSIFPAVVDPTDVDGLYATAAAAIPGDADAVMLYVTGLTVATLAVVKVCKDRGIPLTCLHFDKDSGSYFPQQM